MITLLEDYVFKYVKPFKDGIIPGEHHFVALYLAPKLYKIGNIIPDYINPDGMKKLPGDLIYYSNVRKRLSIEVKFLKINFTKFQCNEWLLSKNNSPPDFIVALGLKYLLIQEWNLFTQNYKEIILSNKKKELSNLQSGYTPSVAVDDYCLFYKNTDFVLNYNGNQNEQKIDTVINKIIGEYL